MGKFMAASSANKWWKNAIIYQIYPRTFCDSNGDNIGDIPGIISKLHYLKELGVDVIALGPIFPSHVMTVVMIHQISGRLIQI